MNLKPLGDRVVVEREEAKGKTVGGIVLPDTAKDKPQQGKVLAVGEGRLTKDGKRRELQVRSATRSCSPPTRATSSRLTTARRRSS